MIARCYADSVVGAAAGEPGPDRGQVPRLNRLSSGASPAVVASVAQALGMYDAVNLDGGGSTTMSVRGALVNKPSDASGERAVGDALIYVPAR